MAGENAQALKVYQAILIHHRDDLTDPEVVEIHFAIGDLRRGSATPTRRSRASPTPWTSTPGTWSRTAPW